LDFITRIRDEIEASRKDAAAIRQATEEAWKAHAARMEALGKESDELLNQLEQLKNEVEDLQRENAVAAAQNAAELKKQRQLAAMLPDASSGSSLAKTTESFIDSRLSSLDAVLRPSHLVPTTAKDATGRIVKGYSVSYGAVSLFFNGEQSGQLFLDGDNAIPEVPRFTRSNVFPLDVTGKHPELLTSQSGIVNHLKQGGIMMIPILLLGLSCILIMVMKILELFFHRPSMDLQALDAAATGTDATGEALEDELFALAQKRLARHGRFIFWLSVSASAAPLLGLLGTVTGMIHTFRLITFFGVGDARLLADGISEALITTEAGLCIAIPALLCHAWLNRRLRHISTELEAKITQLCGNAVSKHEQPPQEQP